MPGDCRDCGACCFSDSSEYVELVRADVDRLGGRSTELVVEAGGRFYMKMRGGHCAALQQIGSRWSCSVHSARPDACRELLRGSPECLEERHLKLRASRVARVALG